MAGMLALCAMLATLAAAGEPPRKTSFSTNEPVEVPGMLLAPGRYVLRLIDQDPQRNVLEVFETVQLWSENETQLLSTMLTMPNYDLPTTDKTVFTFIERGPKQPKALRLWFAPGRNYGQEFVYPKAQAIELAKVAGRAVLAMPAELPGDIGRLARMVMEPNPAAVRAPLVPAPDAGSLGDVKPERPAPHAEPASTTGTVTRARIHESKPPAGTLPKTGSLLPLLASLGLLSLFAGMLLRILHLHLERT
ncbi:MAG TPA: hypothetical protein VJN43_10605 [Bryobacteraceae bacterium]|nr:hypothetical protein [Bryobacteraceae bacterium]